MDGLIILKLIFDKINPSVCVNICSLIKKINKIHLKDFDEDVAKMVTSFQQMYNEIVKKDPKGFSNVKLTFFDALLTSTNKDFTDSRKTIVVEWYQGKNYAFEQIKSK